MSTRGHTWADSDRLEILDYVHQGINTPRALVRHSGLPERRVQRRITDLLQRGWIRQTGVRKEFPATIRVFAVTEEGTRNVPSAV